MVERVLNVHLRGEAEALPDFMAIRDGEVGLECLRRAVAFPAAARGVVVERPVLHADGDGAADAEAVEEMIAGERVVVRQHEAVLRIADGGLAFLGDDADAFRAVGVGPEIGNVRGGEPGDAGERGAVGADEKLEHAAEVARLEAAVVVGGLRPIRAGAVVHHRDGEGGRGALGEDRRGIDLGVEAVDAGGDDRGVGGDHEGRAVLVGDGAVAHEELVVPEERVIFVGEILAVARGGGEAQAPVAGGAGREDDFETARRAVEVDPLVLGAGGAVVRAVEASGVDEIADAGARVDHLVLRVGAVILDGTGDPAVARVELEADLLAGAAGSARSVTERIVGVDERGVVGAGEVVVGAQPVADTHVNAEVVAAIGLGAFGPGFDDGGGDVGRALEGLVTADPDEGDEAVLEPACVVGRVVTGDAVFPVVAVVVLAADAGEAGELGEAEGIIGPHPRRVAGVAGHADVVHAIDGDARAVPAAPHEGFFHGAAADGPPDAGHRGAAEVAGNRGIVDDVEIRVGEIVGVVGRAGIGPLDVVADEGLALGAAVEKFVGQHRGAAHGPAARGLLGVGVGPAVGPFVERVAVEERGAEAGGAAGVVGGVVVVENVELRREPLGPHGLGSDGEHFVVHVFGAAPAAPRIEVVEGESAVGDGAARPGQSGCGVDGAGETVVEHVGEAEVVAGIGGSVGERDVLLIGVQDALVDRSLALHPEDSTEGRELEGELAVEALRLVADKDAAVFLRVVQIAEAKRDIIAAPVVVELALLGAVLVDAPFALAVAAVEVGALGHGVDRAAGPARPVEQTLRTADDLGALDVERARDADGRGAEIICGARGGKSVAVDRAATEAAHAESLVAEAVARLLGERVGFRIGHDGAGARAVVVEHLLDRRGADVAHEALGEDIGRDRDLVERGVKLRDRVGIEGAVAVVGVGFYLEGIESDEIAGGFFLRRLFLGGGDFGGGGSWHGGLTESRREEREWREEEGGANQGVHGW